MPNEETVTIHETAPDGTETTIEITSTKTDNVADGDDKTLAEEVYEAIFDDNDESDQTVTNEDVADDTASQSTPTDAEIGTDSAQFTIGQEMFPEANAPAFDTAGGIAAAPEYVAAADDTITTDQSSADAEAAEQLAHADAAREAQQAADEFVAQGDYQAASEAREAAENEAWEASDSSMLGNASSAELEGAAYKQEEAEYYRGEQAEDIEHGDYTAAKEDAQNAAFATSDADFKAGGDDHTGQSDQDAANLGWAVWDEKNADSAAQNADWYAAQGDYENAETSAEQAEGYQATADEYADRADPTSGGYDYDASSAVDSGGSYDAGYDATAIDSGVDTAADTSAAASYDPGTDNV